MFSNRSVVIKERSFFQEHFPQRYVDGGACRESDLIGGRFDAKKKNKKQSLDQNAKNCLEVGLGCGSRDARLVSSFLSFRVILLTRKRCQSTARQTSLKSESSRPQRERQNTKRCPNQLVSL